MDDKQVILYMAISYIVKYVIWLKTIALWFSVFSNTIALGKWI